MEDDEVVKALAALAQVHRLRAFRALVVAGEQGLSPGDISEQLSIPANTLSFHLKELSHAGLITQTRDGRRLIYRAAFERMQGLLDYLTANCCGGGDCAVSSTGC